ncbi:hypothetical protein HYC85_021623 [Camellia sinensis]|uniref:Uncharacterized protein n=1 Tax=Camellia sinensis TaxID=4442 RepID=A0A7J7GLY7_CAMSI|nr:hypothetical protein HYC85_021623 [Camellia sinensis]
MGQFELGLGWVEPKLHPNPNTKRELQNKKYVWENPSTYSNFTAQIELEVSLSYKIGKNSQVATWSSFTTLLAKQWAAPLASPFVNRISQREKSR